MATAVPRECDTLILKSGTIIVAEILHTSYDQGGKLILSYCDRELVVIIPFSEIEEIRYAPSNSPISLQVYPKKNKPDRIWREKDYKPFIGWGFILTIGSILGAYPSIWVAIGNGLGGGPVFLTTFLFLLPFAVLILGIIFLSIGYSRKVKARQARKDKK
jgi:hypothetical protein